jgi:predicted GIY-YIG superfamily endonuclease
LERRLREHNGALTGYSKRYTPWQVRTRITFMDDEQAALFEKYLKSGSGFAFLKKRLI